MLRPEEYLVDGEIADDARLSACGRPDPLVRVAIRDERRDELPPGEPARSASPATW